ncbi:MAG: DUF4388 domain-containing protein [Anaerolineales bacterium]
MALKGNLRDFSVTQLLNLINLAHKTGTLTIEGPSETAWVSFREGKLISAQVGNEDGTLTGILSRAGKITPRQSQLIKENAGEKSDKELGLLLINAGYISQQDVLSVLRGYVVEVTYRLFGWAEGFFRFDPDVQPPDSRIPIRVELEDIIIEGTRRMKEYEELQEELPNLDMALNFVDRPGANIRDVNLNAEEWKVVGYINPKNSIRAIAKATKMNDLQIRRIAFGLLQAGLVDVVRAEGMPMPPQARRLPPVDTKQQASLVNKLIQRIRSL